MVENASPELSQPSQAHTYPIQTDDAHEMMQVGKSDSAARLTATPHTHPHTALPLNAISRPTLEADASHMHGSQHV